MNRKESIKGVIEMGGTVSMSFKTRISDWYDDIKISESNEEGGKVYWIHPFSIRFCDIDDAVNYFCNETLTSKNVGYIQDRLREKGLIDDDTDLERPDAKLKKLFKDEGELVDQEAKSLNIIIKPPLFKDDALIEFEEIINNFDKKTLVSNLIEFKRKYITIDPFINIGFVFSNPRNEKDDDFTSCISLSKTLFDERLKYAKKNNDNLTFKYIEITLNLNPLESIPSGETIKIINDIK